MNAYREGRNAYIAGLDYTYNPYEHHTTEFEEWCKGYKDMETECDAVIPLEESKWLPCCCCKTNLVNVSEGYDTCRECLKNV